MRTIALAYSGGLDTSIIVPWLREHYDARVICVAADIGQGEEELKGVREKAIASGAEECYVEDLRLEYVRDFIWPTLRAGAIYNRKYLLGTSMARPLIAKKQVEVARKVGADALSHGCTGKGNDQVRFELTYMSFAPDLPVIAPWRMWDLKSREDCLASAAAHNVPVSATTTKIYSRDRNIWHISHEGGVLEDPNSVPPKDLFMLTTDPADAPAAPEDVTIGFEQGMPVSVNGEKLRRCCAGSRKLNQIRGGKHGVGLSGHCGGSSCGDEVARRSTRRATSFARRSPLPPAFGAAACCRLPIEFAATASSFSPFTLTGVNGENSDAVAPLTKPIRSAASTALGLGLHIVEDRLVG